MRVRKFRRPKWNVPRALMGFEETTRALHSIGASGDLSVRRHGWALKGVVRRTQTPSSHRAAQDALKGWLEAERPNRNINDPVVFGKRFSAASADRKWNRAWENGVRQTYHAALARRDYAGAYRLLLGPSNFAKTPKARAQTARAWIDLERRMREEPSSHASPFVSGEILFNAILHCEKAGMTTQAKRLYRLAERKKNSFFSRYDRFMSAKAMDRNRLWSKGKLHIVAGLLREARKRCLIQRDFNLLSEEWLELADDLVERANKFDQRVPWSRVLESYQQAWDCAMLGRDKKQAKWIAGAARDIHGLQIDTDATRLKSLS